MLIRRVASSSLIVLSMLAPAADGQVPDLNRNQPVDALVEDLSPNNATRRHVERGNALFNPNVRLYRPHREPGFIETGHAVRDPVTGLYTPHRFIYRAPGVQARINQPDYMVMNQFNVKDTNVLPIHEGLMQLQRPLDTVFDLIPEVVSPMSRAPAADWVDRRVDGRVNGRLGQLDGSGETPYQTTVILRPLPRHSAAEDVVEPDADQQVVDQADAAEPAGD